MLMVMQQGRPRSTLPYSARSRYVYASNEVHWSVYKAYDSSGHDV